MSALHNPLRDAFGLTDSEFAAIQDFFILTKIKKGDFFLKDGNYVKQLGFVTKGILREFLFTNEKEVTKWFSTPGYFAVDLSAFLSGQTSKVNYQALNDVELLTISKDSYDKITESIPRWHVLEKMFLTKCFSILENRVISHLSMNAEERYNHFLGIQPELPNQVPLNFLASLLGMTPETLSRIRKKQSTQNS